MTRIDLVGRVNEMLLASPVSEHYVAQMSLAGQVDGGLLENITEFLGTGLGLGITVAVAGIAATVGAVVYSERKKRRMWSYDMTQDGAASEDAERPWVNGPAESSGALPSGGDEYSSQTPQKEGEPGGEPGDFGEPFDDWDVFDVSPAGSKGPGDFDASSAPLAEPPDPGDFDASEVPVGEQTMFGWLDDPKTPEPVPDFGDFDADAGRSLDYALVGLVQGKPLCHNPDWDGKSDVSLVPHDWDSGEHPYDWDAPYVSPLEAASPYDGWSLREGVPIRKKEIQTINPVHPDRGGTFTFEYEGMGPIRESGLRELESDLRVVSEKGAPDPAQDREPLVRGGMRYDETTGLCEVWIHGSTPFQADLTTASKILRDYGPKPAAN